MKHEHIYRVYYEDVDCGGIVYYANYFKYIERARTEMLRERGITLTYLDRVHGKSFVVKKLTADFLSPLKFEDLAKVRSEIIRYTDYRIVVDQYIVSRYVKLFQAEVTLACVNTLGRLSEIPKQVQKRLEPNPVDKAGRKFPELKY